MAKYPEPGSGYRTTDGVEHIVQADGSVKSSHATSTRAARNYPRTPAGFFHWLADRNCARPALPDCTECEGRKEDCNCG